MNKMLVAISCILALLQVTKGMTDTCWHCENANSNDDCLRNGYLETCRELNSKCVTEVRARGSNMRITKRCKQDVACDNNEKARFDFRKCLRSSNYQQESWCYCCCGGTNCNRDRLECGPSPSVQPTPPSRRLIAGGVIRNNPPNKPTKTVVEPEPECTRISSIPFGRVSCTNGHFVGSKCSFECQSEEYELMPMDRTETVCQEDGRWSHKVPCCAPQCKGIAMMDTAIVLDSSSSIKLHNWETGKELVRVILKLFKVGQNAARYSIFRYNDVVDEDTLINFNTTFNENELLEAFKQINYNGKGTKTGNALEYLRDHVMIPKKGLRNNVPQNILLFTDGKPTDNPIPVANELKKKFNVITVWVKNERKTPNPKRGLRGKRDVEEDRTKLRAKRITQAEDQLKQIASDESSFFSYSSYTALSDEIKHIDVTRDDLSILDFTGVTKELLMKMKHIACKQTCAK